MKMKTIWKQSNYLFLFSIGFLLFTNLQVSAEDLNEKNGNMRLKLERISELDENNYQENVETELDKLFPTLFQEEINTQIELKQTEIRTSVEQLTDTIFEKAGETDKSLDDMKRTLFIESSTLPKARASEMIKDEDKPGGLKGKIILISFIGLTILLFYVIYTTMRRIS